jgi:hypothetical protein
MHKNDQQTQHSGTCATGAVAVAGAAGVIGAAGAGEGRRENGGITPPEP